MTDPIIDFERASQDLDAFHRQLRSGARIHLPAYHRTMKACEAAVTAIVAQRISGVVGRSSWYSRHCAGKRAYQTRQDADRSMSDHVGRRSVKTLNAYRCEFCRQWHLGNTTGSKAEGAQA